MQAFRFIGPKGFVFSLDAAVSVILLMSAIFVFSVVNFQGKQPFENTLQSGNDALATMHQTGYLNETLDSNSLLLAADNIRQKLLDLIPNNLDARVELREYELDVNSCRAAQNFSSCFLQTTPSTASSGPAVPQKEVFSSKKVLILGEDATQCDLNVELAPKRNFVENGIAFFSENDFELHLQGAENNVDIDFNVTVNPTELITCDQNVEVTLSITISNVTRPPIDTMLVLDRSGSMSWSSQTGSFINSPSLWADTNRAFTALNWIGFYSIDSLDPLSPVLLQTVDPGYVVDVYGEANYLYAIDTAGTDQLFAYDISNLSNLVETDNLDFSAVYGVFALNDFVFVAGDRPQAGSDRGLYIVDATNKNNLVHRGRVNLPNAEDVFVVGNTAFVARGTSGVSTVDVSNPDSPALLDTINPGGSSLGIFVYGGYAFVAGGTLGLAVIDVTDPNNISIADIHTPAFGGFSSNIFVKDNEAFIADSTSLYIVDVSDPFNVSFARRFTTPNDYDDVFVVGEYAFLSSDSALITVHIFDGPRINNAQRAAKNFVDFNGWNLPPDQMGLVSFSGSATLDQQLTSVRDDVKTAIDSLTASGATNIESGIDRARQELTGANSNPQALKFMVLLSDGQSTAGDSTTAAQEAADENIIIFTIGFGADANEPELTNIANITGGQYYAASDENALQAIFNIIALEITQIASDANLSVPIFGGAMVFDAGGGELVDGNLLFDIGEFSAGETWSATYIINFPCTDPQICKNVDALSFPGEGTQLTYIDINGVINTIDFNAEITLDFHKRNLNVDITSGTAVSETEVYLDIMVENVGQLDSNSVDLNFFLNDLNGPFLTSHTVPPLCSQTTPGCTGWLTNFDSVFIPNTGKIYASIGDGTEINECPIGNIDAIFCGSGTPSKFIEIKYFIWRN